MKTALLFTASTTVLTTGILHGQGRVLLGAIWPTATAFATLIGLALTITLLRLRRDVRAEVDSQNTENL